jgi:hypothetical protein
MIQLLLVVMLGMLLVLLRPMPVYLPPNSGFFLPFTVNLTPVPPFFKLISCSAWWASRMSSGVRGPVMPFSFCVAMAEGIPE